MIQEAAQVVEGPLGEAASRRAVFWPMSGLGVVFVGRHVSGVVLLVA